MPEWLWFILIGIVAGWLAGLIMKGGGFGVIGNLIVGILGAILGGFLFRALNIPAYGTLGAIGMATIGAVLLLFLIQFINKKK